MKRVNSILNHPQYIENLEKILIAEKSREFCRHNLQHFLDVARVAYIISLERGYGINKEVIYATALLHDLGRWKQYEDGSDHAIVSSGIAKEILPECGYDEKETKLILTAIEKHRRGKNLTSELDRGIYEGDKQSRPCVECKMVGQCDRFTEEKKPQIYY